MKKFQFLLIIFIVLFAPSVFALDYDVSNIINSPVSPSPNGSYTGEEINGSTSSWNINTRYQGNLQRIRFNIPKPNGIEGDCYYTNMTYKITMNMATEDWRNRFGTVRVVPYSSYSSNWSNGKVTFVSTKKIYFTFKIPSSYTTCVDFVYVDLPSNSLFTPFTGETNWNLKSVILSDELSNGGGGSGGTSTPTPTPQPNNQDIIDNNKQNTQDIINNNNDNTTDIIDNNNQNTQDIINNNNENTDKINDLLGDCHKNLFNIFDYNPYTNVRYSKQDRPIDHAIVLTATGDYTGGSFPLIYHLKLKSNTQYHFQFNTNNAVIGSATPYFYVYHSSPSTANNLVYYTGGYTGFTFTTPSRDYVDYYIQLYITGNQTTGSKVILQDPMLFEGTFHSSTYVDYNDSICTSKLDDTTNAINDVNDTMKDDNIDDKTGFFTDFENNDHGLTSIITLPLSTIQQLTNTSCVSLSIPIPFTNSNVILPCMTQVYETYIPSVYNIWQVVSFGIISYFICLDIFKIVKGLKDPNEDKVEVLDL